MRHLPKDGTHSLEQRRRSAETMWPAFSAEIEASYERVGADGVPAEWIVPPLVHSSHVVLYLHGGGYCLGSIATHRKLAAHIATAAGCRGLIIDYRLAPEHPFPAGLDDAVTAYKWLLSQGVAPADIAVAGDSAGGGLTLATAIRLRDEGTALPEALVCLSPWTDLAMTGDSIMINVDNDFLIDPSDDRPGRWYLSAGEADAKHPLVSPLRADLHGLPRMLIQVGSHEVLLDDSIRLAESAETAGVEVCLEVWPAMQHVFQMVVGMVPEATEAVQRIGEWLRSGWS